MKFKQVIIVNTDLGMRKGKIAAQVAHAAVKAAINTVFLFPERYQEWDDDGHKKVCLIAANRAECEEIYNTAVAKGMIAAKIIDQGLTQIPPDSLTCVAIGPDEEEKIDQITGRLKLLN